jgi:hypothetical protein
MKAEHVKSVRGDVVGGRTERHDPKKGQGIADESRRRDREGHTGERRADHQLHRDDPEPLRPEHIDERAPEGFDHPGKVEPTGIESDIGIGNAKPFVEDNGDRHGHNVRGALGKIEGGDPCPGISSHSFFLSHRHSFIQSVRRPGRQYRFTSAVPRK